MNRHSRRRRNLLQLPTAVAAGAIAIAGLMAGAPSLAAATVTPSLSVAPSAGPVGSVVTVNVSSPAGNGCGGVVFGGGTSLPLGGSTGTQHFVIPSVLGSPNAPPGAPVSPGHYQFSLTCDSTNNPATAMTVSVPFTVTTPAPSRFVGLAPTTDDRGYWLAQSGGGVFSYGDAAFFGSLPGEGIAPAAPIVGIAATPDGKGYWLAGADGGVFGFGDARFYGSLPQQRIVPSANYLAITHDAIVGISSDPAGGGYWLVGADGGVFGFGAARYVGSATQPGNIVPGLTDEPFVGISATADGNGYFEVGYLGGAIAFGDAAKTNGAPTNLENVTLASFISGIVAAPADGGAWLVASDGGVFAAPPDPTGSPPPFLGSLPSEHVVPAAPIVGIAATASSKGYWLVGADGGVFGLGDAGFYGSAGGSRLPW